MMLQTAGAQHELRDILDDLVKIESAFADISERARRLAIDTIDANDELEQAIDALWRLSRKLAE